jgi:lipid-binding SYLF domain-containing protein
MIKKIAGWIMTAMIVGSGFASAESRQVLDLQVGETVKKFEQRVKGAEAFLKRTAGYLVIPNLYKAGFVVGGEYGEGALIKEGMVVDYYSIISASVGFQAGAQKRSLIIAFLTPEALRSFRASNKWKVGVDGSIAFVSWGGGVDISTVNFKKSIVAFAFDNKGLMAGISLDGSVFSRIRKK